MPRLARLDAPGILHHVIIRGIERRKIFKDNKDKDNLLDRLGTLLRETKITCYAWALLSNHAHFLFRTGDTPLSTLMRRVLTGYVVSFNRRYNCGHSVIMDKKKRPWQDMGYVLSFFGKSLRESRKRYLQYVESGIEQGRRPELVGGGLIRSLGGWKAVKNARFSGQDRMKGDHRILGDSAFVMEVLAEAEEKFERFYELKSKGYDLDTIEQKVCEIFGIEPDEIYSKSRQKTRAEARGLYCYWGVVELGYSLADLARLFGMTGQGVGYAVRRGERIAKANNYSLID